MIQSPRNGSYRLVFREEGWYTNERATMSCPRVKPPICGPRASATRQDPPKVGNSCQNYFERRGRRALDFIASKFCGTQQSA